MVSFNNEPRENTATFGEAADEARTDETMTQDTIEFTQT
jgi:hypothetical protein